MPDVPISFPARYAPGVAVHFAAASGSAATVSHAAPLPVEVKPAAAPAALTGTASASAIVGPFAPAPGRPVWLTLAGTWAGSVQLLRSSDGGTTRQPVTVGGAAWGRYAGNACEAAWEDSEAGAQLYLDVVLASGTLAYRLAQ